MNKIVLAFSGGLDTSFCVPYLVNKNFEVHTIFVNTGGINDSDERKITSKALKLGAKNHINVNVENKLWNKIVKPLIWSGSLYQNQYPILCSDRYLIVSEAVKLCKKLNTNYIAHGCTGMGNDQIRFDQAIKSFGSLEIISPIRDIQKNIKDVREYEIKYLENIGYKVPNLNKKYSINENLMGVTISGSEIDSFKQPTNESYILCAEPKKIRKRPKKITIEFLNGSPIALNKKKLAGANILRELNKIGGKFGIGREIITNDTIIGIKGRIVFESPGIVILMKALKSLEDALNTKIQNEFKHYAGSKWINLVYQGFYYEPLRINLEKFLEDISSKINGAVVIELNAGRVDSVQIISKQILFDQNAIYAQSSSWDIKEASGFIKLHGKSTDLWNQINKYDYE